MGLPPSSHVSPRAVAYAGLAGNLLVAVTKFIAAALTNSSAMLSEAVHSVVDSVNELLILYGLSRARRPPDEAHPLGHGRELYFWSFVVSVLIFALGAGVSFYEGVMHVLAPVAIVAPTVNYVVLGFAFAFEGASWLVAHRGFQAHRRDLGMLEAARLSKDPSTFIVLFEDSAALLGIVIAFAGTAGSALLGMPVLDGLASIAIGLLLAAVAVFLARESKQLLIGEGARPEVTGSICRLASTQPGVERANGLLTVQVGPNEVVAALSLEFADSMRAPDIERVVEALEERVRAAHPEVVLLMIKPQTPGGYARALRARAARLA